MKPMGKGGGGGVYVESEYTHISCSVKFQNCPMTG